MLLLIISHTRSWIFAWHPWRATTESKNIVKLLAISPTIHTVCYEDDYLPKGKSKLFNSLFHSVYLAFPKRLFPIADLFAVRYLWVVCYEDKCCVVTQRAAEICVAWFVYLACLRSHILRACYNFDSKQTNLITLFGRRPNNNCQRASWAQTVGLRGGQLNATRSIAAGRKILDRAVKSVM